MTTTENISEVVKTFPVGKQSEPAGQKPSWLERTLKPKTYNPRYPFVGKPLLWMTCAFGSLGDALFDYDQGIMAGLLVNPVLVKLFFSEHGGMDGIYGNVDPSVTGITVACLQASAAVGSLNSGRLGHIIGRKKCVRIGAFIYFECAFIQGFAPNLACFIAGHTIQGLAVGFLSLTVPVIQTGIAAPHRRRIMVGIEYSFLIGGYALSCWVDYGFYFALPSNVSWQGPGFVQMAIAFVLFSMSLLLPETPRRLDRNGFAEEALQTLADLHADGNINDHDVQHVFREVQDAVRYEASLGQCSWLEMFTRYKKRIFAGISVVSFYLPSVLARAGCPDENSSPTAGAGGPLLVAGRLPAEIFPLGSRPKGVALATCSNSAFDFIIGVSSPDAFAGIDGYYYYVVISGFCLFSAALARWTYVETAGCTLEEIARAFGDRTFALDDQEAVMRGDVLVGDEKA
ncbi:mfs sugar transporter [Diplodia corticola]|uniref:Mfs sugar transporter n=1 Tax=Diplodia corticola TaxID=236234 RepID=A0A1J9RBG1_9PEZI|nr:mfs sugar transporter [Diplodia corticola]OJD37896.1 mfs sugar transporter [Diplodia corticola]